VLWLRTERLFDNILISKQDKKEGFLMILCIKQKILASTREYNITDQNGNPVYHTVGRLKGQFMVAGNQIHIMDTSDREVAWVHEVTSFLSKFEIYINGVQKGLIAAKFSLLRPKFRVDFMDYHIQGDIVGWYYDIYQKDRLVGHMSQALISIGSVFSLDCPNPEDQLPALCLALAIDCTNANGRALWDWQIG
jgi:uncharacterized protein YxjI